MKIYYAHPVNIYDTIQEKEDLDFLKLLFPNDEIINPNTIEHDKAYKEQGMPYFFAIIVEEINVIAFRALPTGKISAGVMGEIRVGLSNGVSIIELPYFKDRGLSVNETRNYFASTKYERKLK